MSNQYNVFCNGRWMTYEWADSVAEAIAKATRDMPADNAIWTAEQA